MDSLIPSQIDTRVNLLRDEPSFNTGHTADQLTAGRADVSVSLEKITRIP